MKLRLLSWAMDIAAALDVPEWLLVEIQRHFWAAWLEERARKAGR